MKELFEFLGMFDWISPAIETAKDLAYTLETGELGTPIDVRDPYAAAATLKEKGVRVISITTNGPWGGKVDVPDQQVGLAKMILGL